MDGNALARRHASKKGVDSNPGASKDFALEFENYKSLSCTMIFMYCEHRWHTYLEFELRDLKKFEERAGE